MLSHPSFGPADLSLVLISTISPVLSSLEIGTIIWLTIAPTILSPTPVWILYAKSIGVAPVGSSITLPKGVKT